MKTSPKVTDEELAHYIELQRYALDCARNGADEALESMLEAGMPIDLKDEKGNTLLMMSSYHGQVVTVRMLLRRGAKPDERNDRGQTPLAGVAFKGHCAVAQALVEGGADPNAHSGSGLTALHFARIFGRTEVAAYLESRDAPKQDSLRARLVTPILTLLVKIVRIFR